MSQLAQLNQRIKVIGTIKKTTNAMRLIAMSLHSRLRQKKNFLESYREKLESLLTHLNTFVPHYQKKTIVRDEQSELIIIIGSQKGLAGTFNSSLAQFFFSHYVPSKHINIIAVGKQIIELLKMQHVPLYASYNAINSSNFLTISHILTTTLFTHLHPAHVTIYSVRPRTFFSAKPEKRKLNLNPTLSLPTQEQPLQEIIFEQDPEEIYTYLQKLHTKLTIQEVLFNSLLAEQAARFISMDTATQNAEKLLMTMRLNYNKLRQTAITRELTDTMGAMTQE
jgi:F-type H+-transporting ATPase subunit gamma